MNPKKFGLILGILLFMGVFLFFDPEIKEEKPLKKTGEVVQKLTPKEKEQRAFLITATLAVALLMACWWMSETLPLPVTALIPLILFPILEVMTSARVATQYMNKHIFLLMGGFLIALAMEIWGLHKRLAFSIIRILGQKPKQVLAGFMISTAFLSMWISNTATTLMMLPIAMSLILHAREMGTDDKKVRNFALALLLAIAYSANIGGMGTLIGTPPNVILKGVFEQTFPGAPKIDFVTWFVMGLPLVILFVGITWFVLVYIVAPVGKENFLGGQDIIKEELKKLGTMKREEKWVLFIFGLTALLWMTRKKIDLGNFYLPGWGGYFPKGFVDDTTVVIFTVFWLFLIPSKKKARNLLAVEDLPRLPWGIIILFGGGFALAEGFRMSGLSQWIGHQLYFLEGLSPILIVLAICLILTFLTEMTSNTVTTQLLLPILASVAVTLKLNPLLLMIPATLSASCAFMLPVATLPNAIVFGTGYIPVQKMVRAGILLNLIGAALITLLVYFLGTAIWGISLDGPPPWLR